MDLNISHMNIWFTGLGDFAYDKTVGLCCIIVTIQEAAFNKDSTQTEFLKVSRFDIINPLPSEVERVELSLLALLNYNVVFTGHEGEPDGIDISGPIRVGIKDSVDADGRCQQNGRLVVQRVVFHLPRPY